VSSAKIYELTQEVSKLKSEMAELEGQLSAKANDGTTLEKAR